MNKTRFRLIAIFAILTLGMSLCVSCSKDGLENDDNITPGTDGDSGETPSAVADVKVHSYVYPDVEMADGIVPRLTIVGEKGTCTELYDPENPETMLFHYMYPRENVSLYVLASHNGMILFEENPFAPAQSVPVTIMASGGSDLLVSCGEYDKNSHSYNIESNHRIEVPSGMKIGSRGDGMNFAREQVLNGIIRPMAEVINHASDAWSVVPRSSISGYALSAFSEYGLVMAECLLYSNSKRDLDNMVGERIISNVAAKIVAVNELIPDVLGIRGIYNSALYAYRLSKEFSKDESDEDSELIGMNVVAVSPFYRQAEPQAWEIIDESAKYRPTVRLVNVEGASATVCGDFSNFDGRFTVTGYYLYQNGKEISRVQTALDGSTTYTFSGLEKGAKYAAVSYVSVMGDLYLSAPVHFMIEGDLEVSQTSAAFSDKGGELEIVVTPPSDTWTWTAKADQSWCKLKVQYNKLTITASASSSDRTAEVTVTAQSPNGDTQQRTITVTQKKLGKCITFFGIIKFKSEFPNEYKDWDWEYDYKEFITIKNFGEGQLLSCGIIRNCGFEFIDWPVSTKTPTDYLREGWKITSYQAVCDDSMIFLNGTTQYIWGWPTAQFTLDIDMVKLEARVWQKVETQVLGVENNVPCTDTYIGTLYYDPSMSY